MFIENTTAPNIWHAEWFYFLNEKVVYQIVLDTWTNNEYTIYVGKKDPNAEGNVKLFKLTGGRTVTIPIPLAGLPIQQWTHLGFYGGPGRMTIWMRDTNHVTVVQEELTVIVKD